MKKIFPSSPILNRTNCIGNNPQLLYRKILLTFLVVFLHNQSHAELKIPSPKQVVHSLVTIVHEIPSSIEREVSKISPPPMKRTREEITKLQKQAKVDLNQIGQDVKDLPKKADKLVADMKMTAKQKTTTLVHMDLNDMKISEIAKKSLLEIKKITKLVDNIQEIAVKTKSEKIVKKVSKVTKDVKNDLGKIYEVKSKIAEEYKSLRDLIQQIKAANDVLNDSTYANNEGSQNTMPSDSVKQNISNQNQIKDDEKNSASSIISVIDNLEKAQKTIIDPLKRKTIKDLKRLNQHIDLNPDLRNNNQWDVLLERINKNEESS